MGTYAITGVFTNTNYTIISAPGTLTINAANQSITFGTLANKTYGDASFNLSASAGSGLPITYVASVESDGCAVSGNTVTITGAGICSITASQSGNGNYNAALSVTRSFTINAKEIIVTANARSKKFGEKDPELTYITTGLVNITDKVSGNLKRDSNNANDAVGDYIIRLHNLSYGKNYSIKYNNAIFTITP